MKKIFITFYLLCCVLCCWAQENLRDGYVITLQGDTLHGVIDFRTASMNTKRCVFRQSGKEAFTTYLPGEISGYRFVKNGIYYVSKEVKTKNNTTETVFAEYILHGNMDLYQIGEDQMMIVDENGNCGSFSTLAAKDAKDAAELRKEMRDVLPIISKSQKASNILWTKEKNRKNTKAAVMAYVEETCTDGICEPYEYQNKTTPKEDKNVHPWAKVGYKFTSYKFRKYDSSVSGSAPQFSAGVDFHLNRLLRGLMINTAVTYEYGKATADAPVASANCVQYVIKPSVTGFSQLDLMLGPGYQFATGKFMTRVKAGVVYRAYSRDFDYKDELYYISGDSYNLRRTNDFSFKYTAQFGLYAGVGVEFPLKKFSLICDMDYIYDTNRQDQDRIGNAEQSVVRQNGFCISAGVKF